MISCKSSKFKKLTHCFATTIFGRTPNIMNFLDTAATDKFSRSKETHELISHEFPEILRMLVLGYICPHLLKLHLACVTKWLPIAVKRWSPSPFSLWSTRGERLDSSTVMVGSGFPCTCGCWPIKTDWVKLAPWAALLKGTPHCWGRDRLDRLQEAEAGT